MARRQGSFDIVDTFMIYFVLLIVVWGYSIAWYVSEMVAIPGDPQKYGEGAYDTATYPPTPPGDWDFITLLKAGQSFQYHISSRKDIDIVFNVIKETGRLFIVESDARIKTSASALTKSSLFEIDVRSLHIKEKFSIDKTSGNVPTASKYTAAFWNMEGCLPTRYYFLKGILKEGSTWEVPGTWTTVQVTDAENLSGFYTYTTNIVETNHSNYTIWVSKEVPLIIGFDGENCISSGKLTSRLVKYTSESGKTFNLGPVEQAHATASWRHVKS